METKLCRSSPRGGQLIVYQYQVGSSPIYGAKFYGVGKRLRRTLAMFCSGSVTPVLHQVISSLADSSTNATNVCCEGSTPSEGTSYVVARMLYIARMCLIIDVLFSAFGGTAHYPSEKSNI
jgi:hypothetical protein